MFFVRHAFFLLFLTMPPKSNNGSHNINTQSADKQPLNNLQSPCFPFIYDFENARIQTSSSNTETAPPLYNAPYPNVSGGIGLPTEGQSSQPTFNHENSLLQSTITWRKRKSAGVGESHGQKHQCVTRNANDFGGRRCLPPALPNDTCKAVEATESFRPTLPPEISFLQSRIACRKRKPTGVGGNYEYACEDVTRNVRQSVAAQSLQPIFGKDACISVESFSHCLDEAAAGPRLPINNAISNQDPATISLPASGQHTSRPCQRNTRVGAHNVPHRVGPHNSHPNLNCSGGLSGEAIPVLANQEIIEGDSAIAVGTFDEPFGHTRPAASPQKTSQQGQRKVRGRADNVAQRVGSHNFQTTLHNSRTVSGEGQTVLPNEENECPPSIFNVANSDRPYRHRRRKTGGNTHNVRQLIESRSSLNTSTHAPRPTHEGPSVAANEEATPSYEDLGDCDQRCRHCHTAFWYGERIMHGSASSRTEYHLCCGDERIIMEPKRDPPQYIKDLLSNSAFMENIRAYNQMFAMTSFGANIDKSVNTGRGPYVFKVSGQIYHWIGSLCPLGDDPLRFLQLYIYDTQNEVHNRLSHFSNSERATLDPEIVEGLIHFLDTYNELVRVLRTARDLCNQADIPDFKIRLYNAKGARGYELPTSNTLGATVFDSGPTSEADYDV